jgi:hypothetical protein
LRHITNDLGRALAVLALVFLCFAAPVDASASTTIQQARALGALLAAPCGHDGQPQLACHAPNACCRLDVGLLPAPVAMAELDDRSASAVPYAIAPPSLFVATMDKPFRSRAPPVPSSML